jgi:hypothetical protein
MRKTGQTSSIESLSDSGWDVRYPELLKIYHFTFRTPEQAADVAAHITLCSGLNNPYLELGLNEIFLNAIEHGNLSVTAEEKASSKNTEDWQKIIYEKLKEPHNLVKHVKAKVEISPTCVTIEVVDQGNGFDWSMQSFKQPSPQKRHGRGLLLATELCFDEMQFIGKGNVVRCICWKK